MWIGFIDSSQLPFCYFSFPSFFVEFSVSMLLLALPIVEGFIFAFLNQICLIFTIWRLIFSCSRGLLIIIAILLVSFYFVGIFFSFCFLCGTLRQKDILLCPYMDQIEVSRPVHRCSPCGPRLYLFVGLWRRVHHHFSQRIWQVIEKPAFFVAYW